jgi:fructose-1,6-bisphosphatase/inositol monophosphatase family enzyme
VAAVIEGAGGIVTDWSGAAITLDWRGQALAAGDVALRAQALEVLRGE